MSGMMAGSARTVWHVLAITVPLVLSGCGGSGAEGGGGASSAASATAFRTTGPATGAAPSAGPRPGSGAPSGGGGTRIGGDKAGVTLRLPAGWKKVDPLRDDSPVVRASFGLDGETGPLIRSLMERQAQQGTVFAIDASVTGGMAPHLTAGCDRGGAIGASLDQLKRKQQVLAPGSRITDLTVGGRPAFKAAYDSEKRTGPVSGLTVRVPIAADRFCFVDIEAPKGALPTQAEEIAGSFEPA
jgi:hypothetical protein